MIQLSTYSSIEVDDLIYQLTLDCNMGITAREKPFTRADTIVGSKAPIGNYISREKNPTITWNTLLNISLYLDPVNMRNSYEKELEYLRSEPAEEQDTVRMGYIQRVLDQPDDVLSYVMEQARLRLDAMQQKSAGGI